MYICVIAIGYLQDLAPIGLAWSFPLPRRKCTGGQRGLHVKGATLFSLIFDHVIFFCANLYTSATIGKIFVILKAQ